MAVLHLDFETRSGVDLPARGAYQYSEHQSTELLCAYWAIDDGPVKGWRAITDDIPTELADALEGAGERGIHAHNAGFERLITTNVLCRDWDVRPPPLEAFYCTAAQARLRALPGGLAHLPRALGIKEFKMASGKRLITRMCVPPYEWTEELQQELETYCAQDVEVERACAAASAPMTDTEWRDYLVNERINDRGIAVDRYLASMASGLAQEERQAVGALLDEATGGVITSVYQYQRHTQWALDHGVPREAMERHKFDRKLGKTKTSLSFDQDTRAALMADPDTDPAVLKVAELCEQASAGSVSKFRAMALRADVDNKVKGTFVLAGASQTTRYAAWGLQLHNYPRATAPDFEEARERVMSGEDIPGEELFPLLSSMLRGSLMASKGNILVGADWSSIEAITLPWLAGDTPGAKERVELFRSTLADPTIPDVYKRSFSESYPLVAPEDVDKEQRQIGKVKELSLQFEGGGRAVQAMAKNYNVVVDLPTAEKWRDDWRASNRWAVRLWRALELGASRAIRSPGTEFEVGRIKYVFVNTTLFCILPNGHTLSYPHARLEQNETPWGETKVAVTAIKAAWTPPADDPQAEWPRIALYGGLLAENVAQATAACVLRDTLALLDEDDWPVVLHIHDEIAMDVRPDEKDEATEALIWAMKNACKTWTGDMPLEVDPWSGVRYGK